MALRGRTLSGVIFALPALSFLAVFLIYPTIRTIQNSFYSDRRGNPFIGLANYERLLTGDRSFLNLETFPPGGAVGNNVLWLILFPTLCIGIGLITAVMADRVRYESAFKAIIFLPQAIAATAVGVIWLLVYSPNPRIGVVNAGLETVGLTPVSWIGNSATVNIAIIVAAVWAGAGLAMVVFSAAIKGIPAELLEAARVDGASEWRIFRHITVPLIGLPVSVVAVTLVIAVIKVFDIIYIMGSKSGGPAGAARVIAFTYYDQTFEAGRGNYGSAVAILMLLVVIPIVAFNIRRFRNDAVVR